MKSAQFDFVLPKELIAQKPTLKREESRLMVVERKTANIRHDIFKNIGKYLKTEDLMVFNDTKVIPVRLIGSKVSGGKVEILLLPPDLTNFIGKNLGREKLIYFQNGLVGRIDSDKIYFNLSKDDLLSYLNIYGHIPFPPYIISAESKELSKRYQTIYAKNIGSAAAPTAGFHFSQDLITQLKKAGISMEYVTLHVGLGTFAPIKAENIEEHQIHSEAFLINQKTIANLQKAKRVVAVGTTTVRTLETWAATGKTSGETNIYIYPGFEFKIVDAMVTNFHMPHSSLVLLVSAFAGRELILHAYNEGIKMGYRWGSFGDGMLII